MEPEARYTLVGTSVLVLLGLMVAAIVWLVASGQRREVQTYKIYFTKQSLEGLQVRSDVRMRGIRVGAVTGFAFSKTQSGTVDVVIGVTPSTPVRLSTRAVVDRNLITGLSSIRLVNLDETSERLTSPLPGEDELIIAEGESQLQQLTDHLSELAVRTEEAMKLVSNTLSPQNQAAVAETLANFRDVSRNAAGAMKRLDGTLVTIAGTATTMRNTTVALRDDVKRLADRYDTLGAQTTDSVREMTGAVKKLGDDVSQLSNRTELLLADTDAELAWTAMQLRGSADAVAAAGRRLSDPRSALFGPADANLGPGEVRR
jgi:phospholipid/cholesterol/gamma-HCH transport system substrate-binding protein